MGTTNAFTHHSWGCLSYPPIPSPARNISKSPTWMTDCLGLQSLHLIFGGASKTEGLLPGDNQAGDTSHLLEEGPSIPFTELSVCLMYSRSGGASLMPEDHAASCCVHHFVGCTKLQYASQFNFLVVFSNSVFVLFSFFRFLFGTLTVLISVNPLARTTSMTELNPPGPIYDSPNFCTTDTAPSYSTPVVLRLLNSRSTRG